jgi:hypothetical protein
MKAVYTQYEYQSTDGEFFTQAYVTIWGGDNKRADSFDAPWWGIETKEELQAFLVDYYEYQLIQLDKFITEWEFTQE